MWDLLMDIGQDALRYIHRLDREHWIYVFVGVMILGFTCMRGFGSRTNY